MRIILVTANHQHPWYWLSGEYIGAWWRHQMETFSALLALCARNSPVPVNSPHKGQWRGALMFSLIYAWINDWVNNREAGDLRRQRGHYDVIVMGLVQDCTISSALAIQWRYCSLALSHRYVLICQEEATFKWPRHFKGSRMVVHHAHTYSCLLNTNQQVKGLKTCFLSRVLLPGDNKGYSMTSAKCYQDCKQSKHSD